MHIMKAQKLVNELPSTIDVIENKDNIAKECTYTELVKNKIDSNDENHLKETTIESVQIELVDQIKDEGRVMISAINWLNKLIISLVDSKDNYLDELSDKDIYYEIEKVDTNCNDQTEDSVIKTDATSELDATPIITKSVKNSLKTTPIRTSKKRDEPEMREQDELIRSWCNMQCTQCTKTFYVFPEVKVHYRNEHQSNGFVVCCNRKFFRRVRILEHISRHINPSVFA